MRIYADTSFLVSLLYFQDTAHAAAKNFFLNQRTADWIASLWSEFETVNSLRQLCLIQNGPTPAEIEALRRLFKHQFTHGNFEREHVEMDEAIIECHTISAAHATAMRMRSADVLHIAILEQVTPDLFVTRDKEQHDLALARAFQSVLI